MIRSEAFCASSSELIETLWNVNYVEYGTRFMQAEELIETLWNVNCCRIFTRGSSDIELIETLWNVNERPDLCVIKWNGAN